MLGIEVHIVKIRDETPVLGGQLGECEKLLCLFSGQRGRACRVGRCASSLGTSTEVT